MNNQLHMWMGFTDLAAGHGRGIDRQPGDDGELPVQALMWSWKPPPPPSLAAAAMSLPMPATRTQEGWLAGSRVPSFRAVFNSYCMRTSMRSVQSLHPLHEPLRFEWAEHAAAASCSVGSAACDSAAVSGLRLAARRNADTSWQDD